MAGKTSRLTALEMRKQLLLAESDLNRKLLSAEWAGVRNEIHGLTSRLGSLGSLASVAAQVGAASTGFFNGLSPRERWPEAAKKSSWFASLLRGVKVGGVLWSVLRSRR